jgi:hypothetical protein
VIALALSLFLAAAPAVASTGSVLASYSFDDDDGVVTGPDTFAIWQGAWHTGTGRGHARLSTAYHVSGFRSVELHDIAGDKDFPELQGYFPVRRTGRLYLHFAFLTTDPGEELNIALAGPRYFVVQKDGIAFWLGTRKGLLVHHSDSMFKKLVAVEAFVWYTVDVAYDLDSGTYDLSVRREGDKAPLFTLKGQPNASHQPGSAVDKFSFVGAPFSDESNVTYYVDDVVVGTDQQETLKPFVAPGRRKLFLDLFTHYQLLLQEKPRCLPVGAPADLGFGDEDMAALRNEGLLFALQKLLDRDSVDVGAFLKETAAKNPALRAMAEWNDGCAALERDEPERALPAFVRAETARPSAPIYTLSAVLALARLKRFAEADERLLRLSAAWRDDVRYAVASAYVGVARGDLVRAEEWLRAPSDRLLDREPSPLLRLLRSGGLTLDLVDALKRELADQFQARLEETFVAEQYFYVLLWQSRFDLARGYAQRMVDRLVRAEVPASLWYERAGDAAFYGKDLDVAREMYTLAEKGDPRGSLFLKEADLAFLAGDLARERQLREHYYGRLIEE